GTKWLHCTIFSVLVSAKAVETKGAEISGALPAAAKVRPVCLRNRRLVTRENELIFSLLGSGSGQRRRIQIERIGSSTGLLSLLFGHHNARLAEWTIVSKPDNNADLFWSSWLPTRPARHHHKVEIGAPCNEREQ